MQKSLRAGINNEFFRRGETDHPQTMKHFISALPTCHLHSDAKRWVGITGSWRYTSRQIEMDVRTSVNMLLNKGYGIVSGGALGVDYLATQEVLKLKQKHRLKIFLPTPMDVYFEHYLKKASEGVISVKQAQSLIRQLTYAKELDSRAIVALDGQFVDEHSYYERNSFVVQASDIILGYRVNSSKGTTDTLVKARRANKQIYFNDYDINVPLAHA
ncbi:MAG: hypothetical protein CL811_06795 [Colwelliaceae bacterium]|nr:hypothetical protein [Colwelliaceae bacterium]|tara:strand:- start:1440 stop:2084 length:645 start_codon:yes stop_codon:yes gene_type:complete